MNRHLFERIIEGSSAVAADLVAVVINRKHATQSSVVASKSNLQHVRQRMRYGVPQRNSIFLLHDCGAPRTSAVLSFGSFAINVTVLTPASDPDHTRTPE
jgi:hypothetical protein